MAFIKRQCTKELCVDLAEEETDTGRGYQQKKLGRATQAASAKKLTAHGI